MKTQLHSNLLSHSGLTLALALLLWAPIQAQTSMPTKSSAMMSDETSQAPASAPANGMMKSEMMKSKSDMMQRHQAMMAHMKAQDAELTAQVATMNSAPADKKLDLLAALVTRLVEQRTAMDARMGMMHDEMMKDSKQDMPMEHDSMSPHSMMNGGGDKPAGTPEKQN
ncbi:MAG: hypothetical protein ABI273_12690 [Lacunisphaera sp.]